MRYFLIALVFILAVYAGHRVVANLSPDESQEAGLGRSVPEEQTRKQAEEDESIHQTQRKGGNNVPRTRY